MAVNPRTLEADDGSGRPQHSMDCISRQTGRTSHISSSTAIHTYNRFVGGVTGALLEPAATADVPRKGGG